MYTQDEYQTARSPLIAFHGIGSRDAWPKADGDKCCLFEAVDLAGLAIFGSEWTGSELLALDWQEKPEEGDARWRSFLASRRVSKAPEPISHLRRIPMPPDPVEPRHHVDVYRRHKANLEHSQNVAAEQTKWEENRELLARLTAATAWLAEQCRNSKIASFVRFATGGLLFDMHHWEWNVDDPVRQFLVHGGFDRFFPEPANRSFPVFIFLDRASLTGALSMFENVPLSVASSDLSELSPYLQYAVKLALKHGYTSPDRTDKLSVRESEVEAGWKEALPGVPMTRAQVEMLARMIGFPDAHAITHGQRSRRKTGSPSKTGRN